MGGPEMADDGWGWMVDKRCRLMRIYGHDEDYWRKGITGARAWVLYSWALENEATIWGNTLRRSTDCYIAQEITRLAKKKHGQRSKSAIQAGNKPA